MNTRIFLSILQGMSWILIWPLIYIFMRYVHHKDRGWRENENKGKSAIDIIKERYAKGEINKQEFEEKKKDLI